MCTRPVPAGRDGGGREPWPPPPKPSPLPLPRILWPSLLVLLGRALKLDLGGFSALSCLSCGGIGSGLVVMPAATHRGQNQSPCSSEAPAGECSWKPRKQR